MGDEGGAPGSDFLWIGPNSANPKVRGSNGWIEYPVPDEVLMTTRMHVSRKQVEDLVAHLMIWLRTGSLNYD